MYLKTLTLRGFKSFASATKLVFEPGITAIVGPNGSGKSNVVDALAWVMGEQGAKSLRGQKMEDVIFAGTSGRLPLGRAEVSLTIDNTDGALPIDYTEVTISRTLFRNGGSEYAINGTACRLIDVQDLLSDTGMGRQMHVIVGQGQLDQILQATPEQRRGFVEEAAGVLKHRRRKERALRKLESTQAHMARLNDILTEIRRQLKPLGRQAQAARRAALVQAEARDAQARLFADDLSHIRDALAADEVRQGEALALRASAEQALAAARTDEAGAEEALAQTNPRLAQAQETWYALAALKERIASTASIAAERVRHGAEQPAVAHGRDPEALEVEAEQARAAEQQKAAEIKQLKAALDEASAGRIAAEREEAAAESRYALLMRAAADRREGLATLKGRVQSLESRLQASSEEMERLQARADEAVQRAEEAEREYALAETSLGGLSRGEGSLDARWEAAEKALNGLVERAEESDGLLRQNGEAIATLQARIDALRMGIQRRDASGVLLSDAPPGGIVGALAEQVQVPEEWRAALAAALGRSVEAVVVRTLDDALGALALLRAEDLGQAEILVADQDLPCPQPCAGPGVSSVGWAIDLVSCSDSLRPALCRLLDGIAFCSDGASARALVASQPQITAVTRGGDVISPWYVSGGSDAPPSVIEVQAAIEESVQQLSEARHESERLTFERRALDGQIIAARQVRDAALEALHDSDAAMNALAERLGGLSQAGRTARSEAERFRHAIEVSTGHRQDDLDRLETLRDRLRLAEDEGEIAEPDSTERDRASVLARQARSVEMEARLALRTAEEQARSVQGRVDALLRAARQERHARQVAEEKLARQRREASLAALVIQATDWLMVRVGEAISLAEVERQMVEEQRAGAEAVRVAARRVVAERTARVEAITAGMQQDHLARLEMQMRSEQIEQRALAELALEAEVLVNEYGPDQPVPVLRHPDGSPVEDDEEVEPVGYRRADQEERLSRAQRQLTQLGRVNPLALEEYQAMNERHAFLAEQVRDLAKTRKDLLGIIDQVDARVQEVFTAAYRDVADTFSSVFVRLFPGGEGRLVLTDPKDMLATGIELEARPAGKKVKRLSLLSGGERSLVAIAFLISLFIARPSPFYILDEVEAALDDVNLGRLLGIYEELRESSQLLIITHHKRTMQVADALYGVTMRGDGVSAVISQRLVDD